MKTTARIFLTMILVLYLFIVTLSVQVAYAAAPVITTWSSTGGTTQNKDNDQDIMYLAQPGDVITFSVTVSEGIDYQWVVNEADQNNNQNTFVWMVPNEKGIWEINVKVSNADGGAWKEWVVSTLRYSEAPAFFDSFSDGKFYNRTGTDPWDRTLPEWNLVDDTIVSEFDASSGALVRTTVNGASNEHFLEASFPIQVNEYFKFSYDRFCWLGDSQGGTDLRYNTRIYTETGDYFEEIRRDDGHVYFTLLKNDGYKVGLAGISFAPKEPYATGAWIAIPDEKWVHVEIVRQPDHKMFIIDDGKYPRGAWGDSNFNQVGLEYEQTHSSNNELWDNPHLYHASVGGDPGHAGSNFPDVTVEGKFVKIRFGAEHGYEFDNIKSEAYGKTGTGTISGVVTNTAAAAIQGATVTVEGTGESGETALDGTYTITNVPVSTWTVTCTKDGYEDGSQDNVSVTEGATTTADFQLTPGTDIVGLWHFDEGSETTARDSSGNENHGTISGAAWTTGMLNTALEFDGTDDYIEVPNSASFDDITDEITLIARIKPSGTGKQAILEKWLYGSGVNERSFVLYTNDDGKVNFELSADGTNSGTAWLISENSIADNAWTHLAVTSDGTTVRIYVNGDPDTNTASGPSGIHASTANFHIGRWWTDGTWHNPFNGIIDEVKIYKRALTTAEIKADFEAGDTTPPVVTLKTITISGSVDDETVTEVDINGTAVTVTAGAYLHKVDVSSMDTITIIATNGDNKIVTRTIEIK